MNESDSQKDAAQQPERTSDGPMKLFGRELTAVRAALIWLLVWLVVGVVFDPAIRGYWLAPLPVWARLAAACIPLIAMLATTLLFIGSLACKARGRGELFALAGGTVLLIVLLILLPGPLRSLRLLLQGPLLILFGCSIGLAVAKGVREANWIIPVVVVLAAVDIYSVLAGPTRQVMESEKASKVAEYVLVTYPSAGGGHVLGAQAYFGLPDAIVLAFLASLSVRFGLSLRTTLIACGLGLGGIMLLVGLTRMSLPALPYICGAFLIAHVDRLRTDRRSALQLVVFLGVLGALAGLLHLAA